MGLRQFGISCIVAGTLLAGTAAAFGQEGGAAGAEHPATAHASAEGAGTAGEAGRGHEEPAIDPIKANLDVNTLAATIAIFVCLMIVLRLTAWKPIMAGLRSREQAIRDSIEAAAKAKAEADRTTKELEAKMAEVRSQAAEQLTQAKADAVKVADSIRAQAETESAAIKDRTMREIDAAKQQALTEINAQAAAIGTAVARKILQREVSTGDQQRLVDESLAEMAKKN